MMRSVSAGIAGRDRCSRPISWLYLFLGGFIMGTLAMNLWRNGWMKDMDLLGAAALSRLKYLEVDGNALLVYVLRERLKVFILLGLLAATGIGSFAVALYASFTGLTAGIFLSAAVIRYGLKGILLALSGILPQALLLIPAYLMFMSWCCRRGGGFSVRMLRLMCILGVVIIGCALESYVNPMLLNLVLKIF